jgi:hypothetical protein
MGGRTSTSTNPSSSLASGSRLSSAAAITGQRRSPVDGRSAASSPSTPAMDGPRSIRRRTRSTAIPATTDIRTCALATLEEPAQHQQQGLQDGKQLPQPRHCQHRHEQRSIRQQLLFSPELRGCHHRHSWTSDKQLHPRAGNRSQLLSRPRIS